MEDRGTSPFDLGDDFQSPEQQHPPAPADSEPKVRKHLQLRPALDQQRCVFWEYVFSKRKIYKSRLSKYWIVRYGELLLSPPPKADASKCSGPAVFVNVLPKGDK